MPFSSRFRWNSTVAYVGLLALSFAIALTFSYNFGEPINNATYDLMFKSFQPRPWQPEAAPADACACR